MDSSIVRIVYPVDPRAYIYRQRVGMAAVDCLIECLKTREHIFRLALSLRVNKPMAAVEPWCLG